MVEFHVCHPFPKARETKALDTNNPTAFQVLSYAIVY